MARLSKQTIAKMRAVIQAVLAEPEYYDQMVFPDSERSKCGTICCAAGWVVWLDNPERYSSNYLSGCEWADKADTVLGIYSGDRLFFTPESWPQKFYSQWRRAKNNKGRAKAMADRWEYFIATDGC